MKRFAIYILLPLFLVVFATNKTSAQDNELVNVCALGIGNATYLKDFKVKLPASAAAAPSSKFNVILNKGTMYKITVCNAEGYEGKAVVSLLEGPKTLGSNLNADGSFQPAIGFMCQKTGMYNIVVSFKGGKEGAAVAILSYVNK